MEAGVVAEAHRAELRPGHIAVLSNRQPGDLGVNS